jgi:hypothetical protein
VFDGKTTASTIQELSVPATGPTSGQLLAESKNSKAESVTYLLNVAGSVTWLEVWLGAVGGNNIEVPPHCYLSAIEM